MTWSDFEIAYMAALIEGEGHIRPTGRTSARVSVGMTDEDVIRNVHAISGIGSVAGPMVRGRKKPYWTWQVSAKRDVLRLLTAIAPVMGARRRVQIMSAAENLKPDLKRGHAWRPIPHGTINGYQTEKRRGLTPCEACLFGQREYNRNLRNRRAA
jgi:hypothetical protein